MRIFVIVIMLFYSILSQAQEKEHELELLPLTDNVYIHKSYQNTKNYGFVGSNGLVVFEQDSAYIIDTPWSEKDTKKLVNWIRKQGKKLKLSLSTHSHEDRTSGIAYLNRTSVPTFTSNLTDQLLKANNKATAKHIIIDDKAVVVPNVIESFYPGGGHTIDNLVVWLPQEKILFGGCAVRSLAARSLGYTGEARIEQWQASMDNVLQHYPEAEIVVPGHGKIGDRELLKHTKELVEEHLSKGKEK